MLQDRYKELYSYPGEEIQILILKLIIFYPFLQGGIKYNNLQQNKMRQKSIFSAVITGLTFGMVNVGADGIILKDPITGIGNILAHTKDAIFHNNAMQGVWIGKRIISGSPVGFSSYATEALNQNILHYAFMVNGEAFHLAGQKGQSLGSGTVIGIKKLTQKFSAFQWFYKGQAKRTSGQIKYLINQINSKSIQYHISFANCIDVAKAFVLYARGLWSEKDVVIMIFPDSPGWQFIKGLGLLRGAQLVGEGINLIMP